MPFTVTFLSPFRPAFGYIWLKDIKDLHVLSASRCEVWNPVNRELKESIKTMQIANGLNHILDAFNVNRSNNKEQSYCGKKWDKKGKCLVECRREEPLVA